MHLSRGGEGKGEARGDDGAHSVSGLLLGSRFSETNGKQLRFADVGQKTSVESAPFTTANPQLAP